MTVLHLDDQKPFTTKDGSTIHSILDRPSAPVENLRLGVVHKLINISFTLLENHSAYDPNHTPLPFTSN